MATLDLVAIYLEALPPAAAADVDRQKVAAQLESLMAAVRREVPGVEPLVPEIVQALARREGGALPEPERGVDLAIAFAAHRGDVAALAALDALLVASVAKAVARIDPSPAFRALVAQELRTHLLVGERPRIQEYAGRGTLSGWLRTAAGRIALNLRRGAAERVHESLTSRIGAMVVEPEAAVLRARYREHFEASLRAALSALPDRERALLLLTVRDGVTSAQIATLYKVSLATAKRMLARARARLLEDTKGELRKRLSLTSSEFDSVARAVCDDLDVSVARLLDGAGS